MTKVPKNYLIAILAMLAVQESTRLPQSPVNLEAIADAIAARPRSPIENDLALSHVAGLLLRLAG